MDHTIHTHQFPNGLSLVIEPMKDVQSAAFCLLVPAGSIYDVPGFEGTAAVLADMLTRGAGSRDSQELTEALDDLGLQRQEGAERRFISFGAATLAENLPAALELYADIILDPHLPEDELAPSVAGAQQVLLSIEDDPRSKLMVELRRRYYPEPWGRPSEGSAEGLDALTPETIRRHYERHLRPQGAILGIAGNVDPRQIEDLVGRAFGTWERGQSPDVLLGPRGPDRDHIPYESTQTQIGIVYPSVPYRDPAYYNAWAAVGILSGGSSSRLFTEVREKRGLCYAVSASHHGFQDQAGVFCYAGSTNDRAQQTLDVMLLELERLGRAEPIRLEELERCRTRAKSALIMQQESSSSRATSIAYDWYHLGRVTTLSEVRAQLEALTVESVTDHIAAFPPGRYTILTVGPEPLETPRAVL